MGCGAMMNNSAVLCCVTSDKLFCISDLKVPSSVFLYGDVSICYRCGWVWKCLSRHSTNIDFSRSRKEREVQDQPLSKKKKKPWLGLGNGETACLLGVDVVCWWAICAQASFLFCLCGPATLLPFLSSLPERFLSLNSEWRDNSLEHLNMCYVIQN